MTTTITFILATPGDREAALDRRDDITEALKPLGIRVSMLTGLEVHLSDVGVPTLGDLFTGRSEEVAAHARLHDGDRDSCPDGTCWAGERDGEAPGATAG